MTNSKVVLIDRHPGRSAQTIGMARELGADPDLIHEPSVGVVGTKGDSQCYMGVVAKVDAIHGRMAADGLSVAAPVREHSYSFYVDAPGGFLVEVGA